MENYTKSQQEFVENLLNGLELCAFEARIKQNLSSKIAISLCFDLIRCKNFLSEKAVRILSVLCEENPTACDLLVKEKGLALIFPIFYFDVFSLKNQEELLEVREVALNIVFQLLSFSDESLHDRIQKKLVSTQFVDFLIDAHKKTNQKLSRVDREFERFQNEAKEDSEEEDDRKLVSKVNEGLLFLYQIDFFVALSSQINENFRLESSGISRDQLKKQLIGFSDILGNAKTKKLVANLGSIF